MIRSDRLPLMGLFSQANRSVEQSGGDSPNEPVVCIANISPRERRRRLIGGVLQFAVALAVLAILTATGADRFWRLLLFLPFWGAATGFFQWRDKT